MARPDDDDTSAGQITQGGHTKRQGRTIWWAVPAAVIALAIGAYALSTHRSEPREPGLTTIQSPTPG